jgi:Bacterial RNA polymerase, alpha chain C terminal domain
MRTVEEAARRDEYLKMVEEEERAIQWLAEHPERPARRVSRLTNREILDLRQQGLTIEAISDKAGVPTSRIRQIIRNAESAKKYLKKHPVEEGTIEALDLSIRAANGLLNSGITRVEQLTERSEADLLRIPNFGRRSLEEVKTQLARLGLHLLSPPPVPASVDNMGRNLGAGGFRLSLPPGLMQHVVQAAASDGLSINAFIATRLEEAIAGRR